MTRDIIDFKEGSNNKIKRNDINSGKIDNLTEYPITLKTMHLIPQKNVKEKADKTKKRNGQSDNHSWRF